MKTIAEINERIKQGRAVVLTAEEMTKAVKEMGAEKAAKEIDVVTTGTFSPMCSSGMLFNIGQTEAPTLRASKMWLNDVPCHAGLAAVDGFVGATEMREGDPLNQVYPGEFHYGGAHVIEDLIAGRKVKLRCESYTTDCYPKKSFEREITIHDLKYAHMLNPRNCYQNYNVAVNENAHKTLYTYMGALKPHLQNANFATSGELSPLFNDPYFKNYRFGHPYFLGRRNRLCHRFRHAACSKSEAHGKRRSHVRFRNAYGERRYESHVRQVCQSPFSVRIRSKPRCRHRYSHSRFKCGNSAIHRCRQ